MHVKENLHQFLSKKNNQYFLTYGDGKFKTVAWDIQTPFGKPVVPDEQQIKAFCLIPSISGELKFVGENITFNKKNQKRKMFSSNLTQILLPYQFLQEVRQ